MSHSSTKLNKIWNCFSSHKFPREQQKWNFIKNLSDIKLIPQTNLLGQKKKKEKSLQLHLAHDDNIVQHALFNK